MLTDRFDVSVIVPTYNSAEFIRPCIESILAQQGVTVEIHVVDDLGTDETRAILEAIREENEQATLVLHYRDEPLGQATARNVGIDAATGAFVALLDSDDKFIGTSALADWVGEARRNGCEIACAQFVVRNMRTEMLTDGRPVPLPPNGGVCDVESHPALSNVSSCWQLLYSTEFLNRNGLRFSTRLRQREDRPFFLKALLAARTVSVSANSYVEHLNRPDSSFKTKDTRQLQQYLVHLEEIRDSFRQARVRESAGKAGFAVDSYILALINLLSYWKTPVLECWNSDDSRDRDLTRSLFALHRDLDSGVVLAERPVNIRLSEEGLEDLREFALDTLRILLQNERFDLVARMLDQGRLTMGDLADPALRENPENEWIFARYLAFDRNRSRPIFQQSTFGLARWQLDDIHLVLHVGYPKTGTSSLQNFLELNRFRLAERGVVYPTLGTARERGLRRDRTAGHANLVESIANGNHAKALDIQFKELASSPHKVRTLVISSENILSMRFWDRGAILGKLKAAFPFGRISVFGMHRNLRKWIETSYLEMISNPRNGYVSSPASYVKEWAGAGLLDYAHVEECLKNVFGPKNVTFVSYDDFREKGGTVAAFCDAYEISRAGLVDVPRHLENASTSVHKALMVLALKKLGASRDLIEDHWAPISAAADGSGAFDPAFDAAELGALLERVGGLPTAETLAAIPDDAIGSLGGVPIQDYVRYIPSAVMVAVLRGALAEAALGSRREADFERAEREQAALVQKLRGKLAMKTDIITGLKKKLAGKE